MLWCLTGAAQRREDGGSLMLNNLFLCSLLFRGIKPIKSILLPHTRTHTHTHWHDYQPYDTELCSLFTSCLPPKLWFFDSLTFSQRTACLKGSDQPACCSLEEASYVFSKMSATLVWKCRNSSQSSGKRKSYKLLNRRCTFSASAYHYEVKAD